MIDLVKSHTVIAQDYFTIFWRTLGDGRRKPPGFYELLVGDLSYRVLIVCVFIIKLFFLWLHCVAAWCCDGQDNSTWVCTKREGRLAMRLCS